MTTAAWTSRFRNTDTTTFREWGSEFNAKCAVVGLVQTADTGQINWSTVSWTSTTNVDLGYEIWSLNDSLMGSAPVYIKFVYGTGNTSGGTQARITLQVGTGTDGAGNLTGTVSSQLWNAPATGIQVTTDTAYPSYMCKVEGFWGVIYKAGAAGNTNGYELAMSVSRTVDTSGVPDGGGVLLHRATKQTSNSFFVISVQSVSFLTSTAYTARTTVGTAQICSWPMVPTTSLVGSDFQAAVAFTITPRVRPVVGICGVLDAEVSLGTSFTATLVGSTPRTYIAGSARCSDMDANSSLKFAMLYE